MIDFHRFDEVFDTIAQHKYRNISTGFGVAWGIFILIILLSIGEGFQQGVLNIFTRYSQNSLWVYGGRSSLIQEGSVQGKPILFDSKLIERIKRRFSNVDKVSPEFIYPQSIIVHINNQNHISTIKGVGQEYFDIKLLEIEQGRQFNILDQKHQRPVCIIGSQVKNNLFENKENPIGSHIEISGNWFQVIGVLSEGTIFSQNEQNIIFLPSNSFRSTFNQQHQFSLFGVSLFEGTNVSNFENDLTRYLAKNLDFQANDTKALFILNLNEQVKAFKKLFKGINMILWVLGIFLLISGVIGIANMMHIAVKERYKEIGIRKAIGAAPKEILLMIIYESLFITLTSGIIGMMIGITAVSIANVFLQSVEAGAESVLTSLEVNASMAIGTLVILSISGVLAGIIPAVGALKIMPVNALNTEN